MKITMTSKDGVTLRTANKYVNQDIAVSIDQAVVDEIYQDGVNSVPPNKMPSLVDGTLTEITAEDLAGATKIISYGFAYISNLTSVEIPNTVTTIGENAFYYCYNFKNLTIPASVTRIGRNAFGSPSLTTLNYSGTLEDWCKIQYDDDGSTLLKNGTTLYINGELLIIADIPNTITEIKQYAFRYCKDLTTVTIPDSVTSIGQWAFASSGKLTSVTIGDGVTSIGNSAFYNCDSLANITIPDSVTSIGERVFSNSGLTSITIPDSVTSISYMAFYRCSILTNVTIPNSVTSIDNFAFTDCYKLTSLTIPNSVTSIGGGALQIGSSTNKATIRMEARTDGTPPTIQSNTFDTSKLQAIEIPENEISAYSSATQWSNLTSYFVPYQP